MTKAAFWEQRRRKGANFFNDVETAARFDAARALGIEFVRLTPSKWKGAGRDFLIGDADRYRGIPKTDRDQLLRVLDMAAKRDARVIVVPLSLPGARWRQHNGLKNDLRLWTDFAYHQQAAEFWSDLATALQGHPAVYGYNVVNEPIPDRAGKDRSGFWERDPARWAAEVRGTPADINRLYRDVVAAIRSADAETPIVLDGPEFASVLAFPALEPLADPRVLYSFHMYEPWAYNNGRENAGRFSYPGPVAMEDGRAMAWNRDVVRAFFGRVADWARTKRVPASRVFAGEFGVWRRNPGADRYLADVVAALNERGWHWAFYSFREDSWEEMDYEFGARSLPEGYWEAKRKGADVGAFRKGGPVWDVIRREFSPRPPGKRGV